MRSCLTTLAFLSFAALPGCSDPVAPDRELVGTWATPRENLSPQGWYQTLLTFSADGDFVQEVRTFRTLGSTTGDALAGFSRAEGRYDVSGDRLSFEPRRLVWWDSFYGADSPVHVEEPYPWGFVFDDARYTVSSSRLTIHFTTYPLDAPEPATMVFTRNP